MELLLTWTHDPHPPSEPLSAKTWLPNLLPPNIPIHSHTHKYSQETKMAPSSVSSSSDLLVYKRCRICVKMQAAQQQGGNNQRGSLFMMFFFF